ncbi:hypothetical protein ACVWV0_001959 [Ewingella americana]|jgi:hypothetical protein|uniref:type II toxin-antitoxin system RelE/ParE family toxin n=1 Tax=Ewingella americana TaxID=41202 RepID=UPI0012AE7383|nr:type II toxin-antitoxin system RelE/ParE family toxin [Ewingella americana]MRT02357.1 type II toxin-antitoxin system RelE/ParE family toxin [Ewingella americana]
MWDINTTDLFDAWFEIQDERVREDVLAIIGILSEDGPMLGRPFADSVRGSKHPNLKELRIQSRGDPFRAFFAFDPTRQGIILCAGCKVGLNEEYFYKDMIAIADAEYSKHLLKTSKPVMPSRSAKPKKSSKKGK